MKEIEEKRKNTERKTDGVFFNEIRDALYKMYPEHDLGDFHWFVSRQLTNLFRTDVIYGNSDLTKLSLNRLSDEY
jgi:hypothetical protein